MNSLGFYDRIKLTRAKKLITEVYEYNFVSNRDPLSAKLRTVLVKIDHILKEYGEKE